MGSMARTDLATRFINEFEVDAIEHLGVKLSCVMQQYIGIMDWTEQVHLFVLLKEDNGAEVELCLPMVIFEPDEPFDDVLDRICEWFDLDEDTAKNRLSKVYEHATKD